MNPKSILFTLAVVAGCALCFVSPEFGGCLMLVGAVTAAQEIVRSGRECRGTGKVAASTTLYEGTIGFFNAAGYVDDDTASGVNTFAGILIDTYDNSSGANGDIDCEFFKDGEFELTGSGFAQSDVNSKAYASDNYTVTTTSSSNTYIGTITRFVSATRVIVEVDPQTP